jgi:hypothetical protein
MKTDKHNIMKSFILIINTAIFKMIKSRRRWERNLVCKIVLEINNTVLFPLKFSKFTPCFR